MNFLNKFLEKFFSDDLLNKNILITIVLLILVALNLLGVDIHYLSDQLYLIATLVVINILVTIFIYPISSKRLKIINESVEQLKDIGDITESFKEDYDLLKSLIYHIDSAITKILECVSELIESIKGVPNLKSLKLILELKTKGLWNDIFKECLKYLLTYNKESSEIINTNFRNSLNDIKNNFIEFVHQSIKYHNIDEKLTAELTSKINSIIENITSEINKDKLTTEKLYIISMLLKSLEDDINAEILIYLRNMQSNLL